MITQITEQIYFSPPSSTPSPPACSSSSGGADLHHRYIPLTSILFGFIELTAALYSPWTGSCFAPPGRSPVTDFVSASSYQFSVKVNKYKKRPTFLSMACIHMSCFMPGSRGIMKKRIDWNAVRRFHPQKMQRSI
ncbi:hypothetical protein PRIPAC_73171 [Pristionchus pacificus]|uniref:Uncharacterized protein n=1 Tax=Pristionchus pacificus TaxID=54126 RepID=A0A2A6BRL7_PRIPA|nr:hypothetical protein PRIPAC_73171 [Pristionchus pacificus]|eukprot:PDM68466.1 hypothetical protein PRIPAC_43968 [Pristionchus pacificus]